MVSQQHDQSHTTYSVVISSNAADVDLALTSTLQGFDIVKP